LKRPRETGRRGVEADPNTKMAPIHTAERMALDRAVGQRPPCRRKGAPKAPKAERGRARGPTAADFFRTAASDPGLPLWGVGLPQRGMAPPTPDRGRGRIPEFKKVNFLKTRLTKIRKQIVSSEQITCNQRLEIQKLAQIIAEAEEERQRQRKEQAAVVGERAVLSSMLIRRDAELAKVYEAIKVNWAALQRGEASYAERAAEVDFLGERIRAALAERSGSALQVSSLRDLKMTLHALEGDLLAEKTKIKALEEELGRPLNVHRWRMLESADPQRFEMIQRIQSLQKRIISKTDEVLQKELAIQEKETTYVELKNILGRQPGPEVAEQLQSYQQAVREKAKQMRAMAEELDMYKMQVAEFRGDIASVAKELDAQVQGWVQKRLADEENARPPPPRQPALYT